jgi:hypothetical protein
MHEIGKDLFMTQSLQLNKYLPIALLYFFFNNFLLPQGLLYTAILSPLLVVWLLRFRNLNYIGVFFLTLVPFSIVHFINGVNPTFYLKSFLLLFTVYIFCFAFHYFLSVCNTLREIYRKLLIANFLFCIVALFALFIPFLKNTFWTGSTISAGIEGINRLQMLTYEPSYYSTLLVPLALYYYLKAVANKLPNRITAVVFISLPLLLSLSFGVISGIMFAVMITFITNINFFFPKQKLAIYFILGSIVLFITLIVLIHFFPDNIFFTRIRNVLEGRDTSFRGRTFDSFYLGWHIATEKSIFFGVGPGQAKEVGLELFREYYNHGDFTIDDVVIPNAVGETLAAFGLIGLAIRFFLEIYFFFKTRVYENHYRLSMFLFIFVYQFTGSFLTNIAEYAIWILAFHRGLFPEFNRSSVKVDSMPASTKPVES